MCVRNLTRFSCEHETATSVEVSDLQDVTLAVDFVGFLYHLCEQLFLESHESCAWLLLGGCTARCVWSDT
ncbi:ATP-dependent RNA helicase [Phytophthora megakarya]|uniref:ATP-dependent RNA helicase n=1 Tax=Phytophthora megakarya TaxID=4795 RepID=A0A225VJT2_9STRA|nr:ATP-dependent RNA helicase [Phytophthora megakarya]